MIKLIYHQKIHHHIKILPYLCINNKAINFTILIRSLSSFVRLYIIPPVGMVWSRKLKTFEFLHSFDHRSIL